MANVDALLEMIPIADIAKQLGVPESVAESAVKQAIPAIIGGMAANVRDAGGQKSLEKALSSHAASAHGKTFAVKDIDTADGEKIVNNVFGSKKDDVVAAVADTSKSDVTKELIAKLLPIIAPIVISFIASQFLGQKQAAAPTQPQATTPSSSGGIGDVLGGLLGSSQGQEIVGSVLGGLRGGGKK